RAGRRYRAVIGCARFEAGAWRQGARESLPVVRRGIEHFGAASIISRLLERRQAIRRRGRQRPEFRSIERRVLNYEKASVVLLPVFARDRTFHPGPPDTLRAGRLPWALRLPLRRLARTLL